MPQGVKVCLNMRRGDIATASPRTLPNPLRLESVIEVNSYVACSCSLNGVARVHRLYTVLHTVHGAVTQITCTIKLSSLRSRSYVRIASDVI